MSDTAPPTAGDRAFSGKAMSGGSASTGEVDSRISETVLGEHTPLSASTNGIPPVRKSRPFSFKKSEQTISAFGNR